jgi:hypothetical protein
MVSEREFQQRNSPRKVSLCPTLQWDDVRRLRKRSKVKCLTPKASHLCVFQMEICYRGKTMGGIVVLVS